MANGMLALAREGVVLEIGCLTGIICDWSCHVWTGALKHCCLALDFVPHSWMGHGKECKGYRAQLSSGPSEVTSTALGNGICQPSA